jgi:parvulin-like peptidyl-prolyl isomerase
MRLVAPLLVASVLLAALLAAPAPAQKRRASAKPKPAPAGGAQVGPDQPSKVPLAAPFITVNGERVPVSVYIDRMSLRFAPDMREMLVYESLIRQEATRRKITVNAAEMGAAVENAFQSAVSRYGEERALAEELKKTRGWTIADFKAVLRGQAAAEVRREKLATALVQPESLKDEEIDRFYDTRKELFAQPASVRVSHILIRRPNEARPEANEAAKKKAEGLLAQLRLGTGPSFEQLAKENSEDRASAERGGKLPIDLIRGAHPFGAAFEATVFNAPVGLIAEVIPSPDGFHVVRLDSKKEGRQAPLTEVREQVRNMLLKERRAQALDELLVRLRTTATIHTGKF